MENSNSVSEYMCPRDEAEFRAIIERVTSNRFFKFFSQAVWGPTPLDKTRALMKSMNGVDDFQQRVMRPFVGNLLAMTSKGLTYSGLEHLERDKGYLFISNHRDIVVDPLLLEYVLMCNEMPTTDITIGNNLLHMQFLVDLACLNKIFRVVRDSKSIKDYLANSMLLSRFLRSTVAEGRSVWIAQRNGRAKDGNDLTDRGLVKMFDMSDGTKDFVASYEKLNIVPVSISYEIESCDYLKTMELYKTRDGGHYVKGRHEDMKSILTGAMQPKGRIHMEFCKPLSHEDLVALGEGSKNGFQNALSELLERRIMDSYKLFPFNYVAHDLRSGAAVYADQYTAEEHDEFLARLEVLKGMASAEGADYEAMKEIYLGIYANPVDNKN